MKLPKLYLLAVLLCSTRAVAQSPTPAPTNGGVVSTTSSQNAANNQRNPGPSTLKKDAGDRPNGFQKETTSKNPPPAPIPIQVIISNDDTVTRDATLALAVVAGLQFFLFLGTWKATYDNADTLIRINSADVRLLYIRIKQAVEPIIEYKLRNFGSGYAFMTGYSYGSDLTARNLSKTPSDAPFHKAVAVTIAPRAGFKGSFELKKMELKVGMSCWVDWKEPTNRPNICLYLAVSSLMTC